MLLRAFVMWFGFVLMAVINGAVRESVISPRLGAVRGGQLSAILLALIILLVTYASMRWLAPGSVSNRAASTPGLSGRLTRVAAGGACVCAEALAALVSTARFYQVRLS